MVYCGALRPIVSSLVSAIVATAYQRRALVLVSVGVVAGLSAIAATRVTVDTDVLSLLPRQGKVVPAFRRYVGRFGSMDDLYVVFTAPAERSVSEYEVEIDAWIDRLRDAKEIAQVDAGVIDRTQDFSWLADRELFLLQDGRLEAALERLTPAGLTAALTSRRELLALPSSQMADLLRQDPVGLSDLITAALGSNARGLTASLSRGYVSEDGRSRLLIARPIKPPYDTAFSQALDERLRDIARSVPRATADDPDSELPPLDVAFAGGHRIAIETESVVKRESIWNTFGSLALILPLLFFVFRSLWLVLVGPLPSALSLVVVAGVLAVSGVTLSAAAAGSAAMLFGLGVDGVVLLYVTHRLAEAADLAENDRVHAVSSASSSMLLGMWTTAATFYGLMFVDIPSLQQLGLLIGHSMMACGVLTLVMVPALLPRSSSTARRALTMPRAANWLARHRRTVLMSAAVATLVLGVAASGLRVNPTLDRLRAVTDAARLEERLAPIFGLPRDVYVVLAEGPALEPLLEANERLAARLAADLPDLDVQAPTRLLPSQASQTSTASRVVHAALSPDKVRQSLGEAATAAGFREGAFQPFAERLPRLLDPSSRLTYDGYLQSGLGDLVRRFVVRDGASWLTATYVFAGDRDQADAVARIVSEVDGAQVLTGLPLVNRELADRFLPQFLEGLAIGTAVVLLLVVAAFRDWRLSLYALLPTLVGLLWAAGLLALVGVELDLFAVFAVVTFIGVGVDYGIHLVHRFREHADAVRATAELAPVILVAAAITFAGYGTLVTSSYPPLRSIGIVSGVSVVTLAVASVLVLPALLMGRRP
jgi:uncharacterized protein